MSLRSESRGLFRLAPACGDPYWQRVSAVVEKNMQKYLATLLNCLSLQPEFEIGARERKGNNGKRAQKIRTDLCNRKEGTTDRVWETGGLVLKKTKEKIW
jgi:hypothetical protein